MGINQFESLLNLNDVWALISFRFLLYVNFPNIIKLNFAEIKSILEGKDPGQNEIDLFSAEFTIVPMWRGRFEVNVILFWVLKSKFYRIQIIDIQICPILKLQQKYQL